MKPSPVSVVIPSFDDVDLLALYLPSLVAELDARKIGDEVIVVDDTGRGAVAAWIAATFPEPETFARATVDVRCIVRATNGGFGKSVLEGVEAASHAQVLVLHSDVRVRPGFLAPLQECLRHDDVAAVVPRVLSNGCESHVESFQRVAWIDGRFETIEHGESIDERELVEPTPVPFARTAALLVRRADFLRERGFDALFQPFQGEDADFGWRAWRAGSRVVLAPDSVVEHHHHGAMNRAIPPELVRAASERNRLLFTWKHVEGAARIEEHLSALSAQVIDAVAEGREEDLRVLVAALEEVQHAHRSRASLPKAARSFDEILSELTRGK